MFLLLWSVVATYVLVSLFLKDSPFNDSAEDSGPVTPIPALPNYEDVHVSVKDDVVTPPVLDPLTLG